MGWREREEGTEKKQEKRREGEREIGGDGEGERAREGKRERGTERRTERGREWETERDGERKRGERKSVCALVCEWACVPSPEVWTG